jgi:hypothetical protein
MKNRYYGDKKDFIKYGLLDILSSKYHSIGINWYLTDDRHGNLRYGNDTRYLEEQRWRYCNPNIFDKLKKRVHTGERYIKYCKKDDVVKLKSEFIEQLPDSFSQREYQQKRLDWHFKARNKLVNCDLIFFDPDIGVKIKNNLPTGVIRQSEYATIEEISDYDWCDWLIIQFLRPMMNKFNQLFSNPISQKIAFETNGKKIVAFIAGPVAFLYVTDQIEVKLLQNIFKKWDTKISTQILIA